MKKENKACKVLSGVQALLGFILVVIVKVVAPVCTGMLKLESGSEAFMKCHYTGQILMYFGVLLIVAGAVAFVVKQFAVSGIFSIVLGILVIVVVGNTALGVGVCANTEMACNLTAAFARIIGGIAVITGICTFIGSKK